MSLPMNARIMILYNACLKSQFSISSWVNISEKPREDSDNDCEALLLPLLSDSVTTSDKDISAESADQHDSEAEENR